MVGPPGSGKTMLASRLPGIMPDMTTEEILETSVIYSMAGKLPNNGLVTNRPFRAVHHTASPVSLAGGGSDAKPGEISLAHNGVLFLDELPEFNRSTLEILRQPMESGKIMISRARHNATYPAKFQLIAAMNPCPCGYLGDKSHDCRCTQRQILKYQSRVSGPLLDRIDIHIEVPAVAVKDLPTLAPGETSAEIRQRVLKARAIQEERYRGMPGVHTNADVKSRNLAKACGFTERDRTELVRLIERLNLSARAYDKVLRVARTLADLRGSETVGHDDILEALTYRRMDGGENSFWI